MRPCELERSSFTSDDFVEIKQIRLHFLINSAIIKMNKYTKMQRRSMYDRKRNEIRSEIIR